MHTCRHVCMCVWHEWCGHAVCLCAQVNKGVDMGQAVMSVMGQVAFLCACTVGWGLGKDGAGQGVDLWEFLG